MKTVFELLDVDGIKSTGDKTGMAVSVMKYYGGW